MRIIGQIFQPAIDFILPERCNSCGVIVHGQGGFCAECWQQLVFLAPPWCNSCATPIPFEGEGAALCASCISRPPKHDGIRAAVAYGDAAAAVVLKFKYGGRIGLAKLIAQHLRRHMAELKADNLIIAPVPLHWTRLWSRGYNQSALIARELSNDSQVPGIPDLLLRTRRTPPLRGMAAKERQQTVAAAFSINPRHADQLSGRRVILVDDVYTSGATSDACVRLLKKYGASEVLIFCWARVIAEAQELEPAFASLVA